MADILIFVMKMPENEPLRLVLNPNGQLFVDHGVTFTEYEAVELPEHGDLIDVSKISLQEYEQAAHDALHNGKGSILYDCGVLAGARAITQFVRRQTVIVPSNKKEETE